MIFLYKVDYYIIRANPYTFEELHFFERDRFIFVLLYRKAVQRFTNFHTMYLVVFYDK